MDNVMVALENLPPGTVIPVNGRRCTIKNYIPAKHKFALSDLGPGDPVYMYGILVGNVRDPILLGSLLTTENVETAAGEYTVGHQGGTWVPPDISAWQNRTFDGYQRSDGKVGTANYWIVVPLVFCENRNIEVIRSALLEPLGYVAGKDFLVDIQPLVQKYREGADAEALLQAEIVHTQSQMSGNQVFRNIDGVRFLLHEGGCGGTRDDSENLTALLAGYITHPNVAGATVLSLGCQHAQISLLRRKIEQIDPLFSKPLVLAEQQKYPGEREFLSDTIRKTFLGMIDANKHERKPAPLSKLVVGLECGGSDGFSGISANPALGYASDLVAALGGTTILSEFPELNGVEQELLNRCTTPYLAEKFAALMQQYAARAKAVGSGFDNNPSPGNIRDGLITHIMKSAGAARKGGTSPVRGVMDYGEQVVNPGLNLLCTPGNDVESTTGLAGAGANIIVFTTGLGTPTGNPVCPVIKVSSNTSLSEKMQDIIDFDAGTIIQGKDTIEGVGEKLLDYIIDVASGRDMPAAVRKGQHDFIPWKRGVSL
jgi:altronate hydrolase